MTAGAIQPGDAVPWFRCPVLSGNDNYSFDTVAGRFIVMLFAGSAGQERTVEALRLIAARRRLLDDVRATFFGFTSDPGDAVQGRIAQQLPGIRWFLDHDLRVARQYGAADEGGNYRAHWLLVDPMLRAIARAPISEGESILTRLEELLAIPQAQGMAPVLIVPRVFPIDFCKRLIALYEADGGRPSGFMKEVGGVTVGVHDQSFKRRLDFHLDDHPELCAEIRARLSRNLLPQIEQAFRMQITRIERYVVACYDGDDEQGGFFRAHRDNTTAGTAHRRFACSINLNAEDYEGGDLRFPEFGSRLYRPPTGGALIFSCSLLHEATKVTRGKRYAYLPFFYDEEGARIREAAARSDKVAADLSTYRAWGTRSTA